ncbi:MAG: hypothetical protein FJ396_07755 [Verrucomicrobia bacterium]|nr:hypothetical protein [Verrucomicrobiota bacterium]
MTQRAHLATTAATAGLLALTQNASADRLDDLADTFREATFLQSEGGDLTFDTDLYLTSDTLVTSRPAPGIYQSGGDVLASPRVSVLGQLDYGEKLTLFALGRADRGFDATDGVAKARPDEYYLRLDPFEGPMRFTVGKFGTAYGQWARRYLEWDNPMITAPLAYEWVTTAGDGLTAPTVAPPVPGFLARKGRLADRTRWAPVVWGPSYCSGFRLDGTVSRFDYAFEIKNNALSSRPSEWDLWDRGLNAASLTYQGRFGFRPVTDWNLGLSASSGSYLTAESPGIPAGTRWHDPTQDAVGVDLSWAHGPLEVWSELHWNRFEIPGPVGSVGLVSFHRVEVEVRARMVAVRPLESAAARADHQPGNGSPDDLGKRGLAHRGLRRLAGQPHGEPEGGLQLRRPGRTDLAGPGPRGVPGDPGLLRAGTAPARRHPGRAHPSSETGPAVGGRISRISARGWPSGADRVLRRP